MTRTPWFLCAASCVCATLATASAHRHDAAPDVPPSPAQQLRAKGDYGRIPLSFEANHGQAPEEFDFVARGAGYALTLDARGAWFRLSNGPGMGSFRMRVVEADANAEAERIAELEGKVNYFIGGDAAKWRREIPTYARVRYRQVYRGIDLVYYGNQRQLEYDFIVAPGADWRQIELAFDGAGKVEIEPETGDLLVHVGGEIVRQAKPVVYQEINGERRAVEGSYRIRRHRRVSFVIGEHDENLPLVIDPVLVYSTYLGGSGSDSINDIAVDAAGNAYVCGDTLSPNFPTANAFDTSFASGQFGGQRDAFVAKFNAAGTALVYSTYLGGSGNSAQPNINGDDRCFGIRVDTGGNVYLAGETHSDDFPTANAVQTAYGGGFSDAFVTKLNASGSALIFSTYLGGSIFDAAGDVALDSSNNIYITGRTTSSNYPTVNAIQASYSGGPGADVIISKLNAAGTALVYSTYLGGNDGTDGGFENGSGIDVDPAGNAYITGQTRSTNFPTANAIDSSFNGGFPDGDAFVTKINPQGSALVFSTYLGGSDNDVGFEIAVDSAGAAYIAGVAFSTNFPTANAYQSTRSGPSDGFLTKLNAAGNALVYSTYFGGSGDDSANALAVNASGEPYLAGGTSSSDLPTANPTQTSTGGGFDGFIAQFNAGGSGLLYSTYLGGSLSDAAVAVALDSGLAIYVAGRTSSTNFPTVNAMQAGNGGGQDAFVAKITPDAPTPTPTPQPSPTPEPTPTPTPPPPQLLNISTRLRVGTGGNALFAGFIITGSEAKKVIIRAIGPSLGAQNVSDALADPTLELFDGEGQPIAFNNNWKDEQQTEIEASTIPPSDDLEAAIVRALQPGVYTAVVRGNADGSGIGLVEVYDLAQGGAAKLANISSRGFVETGENVLIGGLIIGGGEGTTRVVIRAIGPSLGSAGVEGALQDPTLQLLDANGTEVRANDDWKESQQTEIEALNIQPTNDLESALIVTLTGGNYTAIVSGRDDSTGVGLVEVYNIP